MAGNWVLEAGRLGLQLAPDWVPIKRVLYAFVVAGELAYIGKSSVRLGGRLQQYKTPAKTNKSGATTNINNHRRLHDVLSNGASVEIYAFASDSTAQVAGFVIDQAAGLEDSLIAELSPPWNARKPRLVQAEAAGKAARPKRQVRSASAPVSGVSADVFRSELRRMLSKASAEGRYIDLTSRELHLSVGGYPGRHHAMPTCCSVMRAEMGPHDSVLEQPPKGRGATLKIRYKIPR